MAGPGAGPRFDALTPRERECLRLVFQFKTSKDIERELGIAKNTIDGYLADAVRKLGARDRKQAALLLAAYEGSPPAIAPQPAPQAGSGADPARVERSAPESAGAWSPGTSSDWRSALPLRRKGDRHNPLPPYQRALWIVLLATAMMIAFGMLASGLAALTDILGAIGLLRR